MVFVSIVVVAAGALFPMLVVVFVVVALALGVVTLVLRLHGGHGGLQRVPALHGVQDLPAVQLAPGGGDNDGTGVFLPQQLHGLVDFLLAHAAGAAEDEAAGGGHLVVIELPEVLHIHLHLGGVHHGDEAVDHHLAVLAALHGGHHIRELAHPGGLDEDAVGGVLLLHLPEGGAEVPGEGAADAPGVHLVHMDARVLQKAPVNADLAKLVLYQHQLLALIGLRDELFDQRRFARAQKTGKNIDLGHVSYLLISEFLTI